MLVSSLKPFFLYVLDKNPKLENLGGYSKIIPGLFQFQSALSTTISVSRLCNERIKMIYKLEAQVSVTES